MATVPAPAAPRAFAPARRRRPYARIDEHALFERHRQAPDPALRDALVERFLPLARHLAARYARAGQSSEDVFQVACLALVKAVDRFDPTRGVAFSSYAVPTVIGELKRHFRDHSWSVHVPRDLQERSLHAARALDEIGAHLGRQPTVDEIAGVLGCARDEALAGLHVATAYRATSLDAPHGTDEESDVALGETIGIDDERLGLAEQRADLAPLLGRLGAFERATLWLRFRLDLTQPEIAAVLGVSQVHVSRTLRRAIERLRRLADCAAA